MLPSKNTLTAEHARAVEAAFETRFADLATDLIGSEPMPSALPKGDNSALPDVAGEIHDAETGGGPTVRKFPITKTVRHRNKEHLKFVRGQPCLVCGRQPSDPHHLRFAGPRALGRKVSDEFTVPLCRVHHREVHRTTKELTWWQSLGIAPLEIAHGLWQKTQSGPRAARAACTVLRTLRKRFGRLTQCDGSPRLRRGDHSASSRRTHSGIATDDKRIFLTAPWRGTMCRLPMQKISRPMARRLENLRNRV